MVLQDIEPTHQLLAHGPGYLGKIATFPGSDVEQPNVEISIQDTMVLQDIEPTHQLLAHGPGYSTIYDDNKNTSFDVVLDRIWYQKE